MTVFSLSCVIFSLLVDIPSLFLGYAIVTKSPMKMRFIRLFLLKMVVCDVLIINSFTWGYLPDLYQPQFPLPLLKVNGFYKYFGEHGGLMAIVTFISTATLSLLAIFEGCGMRFVVTYNLEIIYKLTQGPLFIFIQIGEVVYVFVVLTTLTYPSAGGMRELEQFAINHNASYVLKEFDVAHDVVTFLSPDNQTFWFTLPALILCLFAFPVLLSFITFLTHRKIIQDARLMSSETYAMQRRLTLMLLAQILLPVIMIDLPFLSLGIGIAIVFSSPDADSICRSLYDQMNWVYPAFAAPITLYPLFNAVATILIIKPYRTAILEILPCVNRPRRIQTSPLNIASQNVSGQTRTLRRDPAFINYKT